MPSTAQARRAWGTRYDSLVDNPTNSSTTADNGLGEYHLHDPTLEHSQHGAGVDLATPRHPTRPQGVVEKERANPEQFDASPTTPFVDQHSAMDGPLPHRMPHDASVFVASLPTDLAEEELHSRLNEYLAQFATIKHIKLIKDNRNTVCAFVQVENSTEASELIETCNRSLFMEREIRCERARAFRTLLISWRPSEEAKPVRLRRYRNSRYISVTFGDEALVDTPAELQHLGVQRTEDVLSGPGLFFPYGITKDNFAAFTLLLKSFGRLEFITPFDPAAHFPGQPFGSDDSHDVGGRPDNQVLINVVPGTESSVQIWGAKWAHRNDAVAAVQALQAIPTLSVWWAHTYGRYVNRGDNFNYYQDASDSDPHSHFIHHLGGHYRQQGENGQWMGQRGGYRRFGEGYHGKRSPVSFTETDFPPLSGEDENRNATREGGGRKKGQWNSRKGLIRSSVPSPTPHGLHPLDTSAAVTSRTDSNTLTEPETPELTSGHGSSPVTPAYPATPVFPSYGTHHSDITRSPRANQRLQTAKMQISENATPRANEEGKQFLAPPQIVLETGSGAGAYTNIPNVPGEETEQYGGRRGYEESRDESAIDPNELFIGGLNASWDEERVRCVFGQYGTIENVTFITPSYGAAPHKRAFAFVKYEDVESPQKAIEEEHMRVYEGHSIKVQFRDSAQAKRRHHWNHRGRGGRFYHQGRTSPGNLSNASQARPPSESKTPQEVPSEDTIPQPDEVKAHVTRRFSAPAEKSPKRDIIARLTAIEAERVAKVEGQDVVEYEGSGAREDMCPEPSIHPNSSPSHDSATQNNSSPSRDSTWKSSGNEGDLENSRSTEFSGPDITLITSPLIASNGGRGVTQSEPDFTPSSPQSNLDAASSYPPSSAGGSVPTASAPYYGQPGWMPPYTMGAYGPYGYYPPHPQMPVGQPGADATNPYWISMYKTGPYAPWFEAPPGVELSPPPIRPSGYIQRHPDGIFIPVYPSDRLGQYMGTGTAAAPGASDKNQPGAQSATPVTNQWQNIPPHLQLYPVPIPLPMQHAMMMQHQQAQPQYQQPSISIATTATNAAPGQGGQPAHQPGVNNPASRQWNPPAQQTNGVYPTVPQQSAAATSTYPPLPVGYPHAPGSFYNIPMPMLPQSAAATGSQVRQGNYYNSEANVQPPHQPHNKGMNRRGGSPHTTGRGGGRFNYKRHQGAASTGNANANANTNIHTNTHTEPRHWQRPPPPTSALPAQLTMASSHWANN